MRRTLFWTALTACAALVAVWCLRPQGGGTAAEGPLAADAPARETRQPRPVGEELEARRNPVPVAEAPVPHDAAATTLVHVRGGDGAAIAEAEVFVAHGDAFALAGRTGADGTSSLASAGLGGAELVVRHADFETARLTVAAEAPRELVVTLGPGCALRGIVSVQGTGVPVEGVHVLATRRKRVPSCRDLETPGVDNLRIDQAVSDAFGRFEIRGLAPGATWNLHAAGAGFIGAEVADLRCGAADVELAVLPLYGVRVAFSGPDGETIAVDPDVMQEYGMTVEVMDGSVIDMNGRSVEVALAGATGDCAGLRRENGVFLYATRDEREYVGRIGATFEVPGYERVKALLHAPRVTNGIATQTIALTPVDRERGSLSIEFEHVAGRDPARPAAGGASAYVRLVEAPGRTISLLLRDGLYARIFTGVPHGEYQAQLVTAGGIFRLPVGTDGIPVTISDSPAKVCFDLAQSGGLHVEILDPDGTPFEEMATLYLRRKGRPGIFSVDFLGAPFDVPVLAPGEYELSGFLGTAFDHYDPLLPHPTVNVLAGEVTRLVLADLK